MRILIPVLPVVVLTLMTACAQNERRVWIEPPIGYETEAKRSLYYRVDEVNSGRAESLAIPIHQLPENLVVEQSSAGSTSPRSAGITKADEQILSSLPTSDKTPKPTVSYLLGIENVKQLFNQQKFSQALIELAPLLEQYPSKPELYMMQGTLYRRLDESKLAYASYQKALKLRPDDVALNQAVYQLESKIGDVQND